MELNDLEILNFALENGIIDIDAVQQKIIMNDRKKYLDMHPFSIWCGNDNKWHTYIPGEDGKRIHRKRNTESEIQDLVIKYWKEKDNIISIRDVFNEWNDRRLNLGKISDATHIRNKQVFNRHYQDFGNRNIEVVTAEDFSDFLEEQISVCNLSAKAYGNLKSVTRGMLKRAKKRKLIKFNIEEMFDDMDISENDFTKSIKDDESEVFDENELPKMMDYLIKNPDIYNLAILLMFVTGCRIGEIVALKFEDFIFENAFHVRRTETKFKRENEDNYTYAIKDFPKTPAGWRTVIIPSNYQWIYKKLRSVNPFGEFVFMIHGERIKAHNVRTKMYSDCKILNIKAKSPHKARKTYGSILLDNNIDKKFIEGQMGHTDIMCTELHYHRNRKTMETKQKIIDSIPEFNPNIYSDTLIDTL